MEKRTQSQLMYEARLELRLRLRLRLWRLSDDESHFSQRAQHQSQSQSQRQHSSSLGLSINDVMIFSCLLDPFFLPTPLLTVCILGISPNFEITVACGLRFSWCLWILSLKFQNAMTKCLAETANRAETGKLQFCLLQSLEF